MLAAIAIPAAAQVPVLPSPVPATTDMLGRGSPQSTVVGLLQACRDQNYIQAASYLDLRAVPVRRRAVEGRVLAKQLGQLLDRNESFDAGSLSRNPEGDSSDGREVVATFADLGGFYKLDLELVELHPGYVIWQFSADSVGLIPKLYRLVGESTFEARLPRFLVLWSFLDTALWRCLAMGLLGGLLIAVSPFLSRGLLHISRPLLRRMSTYFHTAQLEHLVGPLRLLVSVVLFRAGMEFVGPSALLRLYLFRLLAFLFAIGLAWIGMRLIDVLTDRARFVLAVSHDNLSSSVLPLANKIVKIIIFALAIAAILGNWGYSTTTVLAGVGVGGLAVALAAQKTIENLFGGVAVISDRPVLVGDICKFADRAGTVEDIGLRSTRIRTLDRTLVTIPNAQFSSMTLENLSRRDKIWFHPRLSLARETSPRQIRELLDAISDSLKTNAKVECTPNSVCFSGVGAYSFDIDVSAYVLTSDDVEFSLIQQDLLLCILNAIESRGARLAIPTEASITYTADSAAVIGSLPGDLLSGNGLAAGQTIPGLGSSHSLA